MIWFVCRTVRQFMQFPWQRGKVRVPERFFSADAALGVQLQQWTGHAFAFGGVVQAREDPAQPLGLVVAQFVGDVARQTTHTRPHIVCRRAQHLKKHTNKNQSNKDFLKMEKIVVRHCWPFVYFFFKFTSCTLKTLSSWSEASRTPGKEGTPVSISNWMHPTPHMSREVV